MISTFIIGAGMKRPGNGPCAEIGPDGLPFSGACRFLVLKLARNILSSGVALCNITNQQ